MDFKLSFSGSASSAANAGSGDMNLATGGKAQTMTLYIVAGVVAVAAFVAWLVLKK